jgi:hypothetical protein
MNRWQIHAAIAFAVAVYVLGVAILLGLWVIS